MDGDEGHFDHSTHVLPRQYLTGEIAPIGGTLKERPEDFIVEEIPLYEPSGEGEHIYLFIQKVGLSTTQLVEILAKHFGVPQFAVGYAGLKDKHAVTRQVVSIHTPGKTAANFPDLRHERLQIMWVDQHNNKLRRGHLKGNRFAIKVRGVTIGSVVRAKKVLERLEASGVPNRTGEQRFGHLENNHLVGRALLLGDFQGALDELLKPRPWIHQSDQQALGRQAYLRGEYAEAARLMWPASKIEANVLRALAKGDKPKRALKAMGDLQRTFVLSAFQSAVFNAVLDQRIADGLLGTLETGDLASKHENNAVFAVEQSMIDSGELTERLQRIEISPSGPMWGAGMLRPKGRADEIEVRMLAGLGVTPDDLAKHAERTGEPLAGERRPLRVPLMYPSVEGGSDENGVYIKCSFELPPGSFATVVMREVMKPELLAPAGPPTLEAPPLDPSAHDGAA